jgi:hypothetical protein
MLSGPVGSRYPGKYAMFAMAALLATVAWRSSRFALRAAREQRKNAVLGTSFKPESKKSIEANIAVAVGALCLLAGVLVAIYKAWPN